MTSLAKDISYAARGLRHSPVLMAVPVLTLALGIGAVTAIFSLIDGVLLSPLPYPGPERLVRVEMSHPRLGTNLGVSLHDFEDWRRQACGRTFAPGEDLPGGDGGAVVSYAFWQSRLGADPGAVGTSLTLDGRRLEVVGVMPGSCRPSGCGSRASTTSFWNVWRRSPGCAPPAP